MPLKLFCVVGIPKRVTTSDFHNGPFGFYFIEDKWIKLDVDNSFSVVESHFIDTKSDLQEPALPRVKTNDGTKIGPFGYQPRKELVMSLLKWALIFLLISLVAALFGFTGISVATADIARILFFIFVVIFLVLLVLGLTAFRA
jgi:uncharacterized membrane protein YtjA (UPF0391 family)